MTKKGYVFIYSRTSEKDYRPITQITSQICPNEFLMRVEARATGLLRASDHQLEEPQWLFMKEDDCAIWGLACMNKLLDEQYSLDKTGTPIRCFVAIVIPDYKGQPLPFEIEAFVNPFHKVMDVIFNGYSSYVENVSVDLPNCNECVYPSKWNEALNTDIRYCKFFSRNTDGKSLLGAAISYEGDISIAINIADDRCVNNKKLCPPMNAVMRGETSETLIDTGLELPVQNPQLNETEDHNSTEKVISSTLDNKCEDKTKSTSKPWIKNVVAILLFISMMTITYYTLLRPKPNDKVIEHQIPLQKLPRSNDSTNIENNKKKDQNGIPQQNRGVHEGTNEKISPTVPEGDESNSIETETDPVSDPYGDFRNDGNEKSSYPYN